MGEGFNRALMVAAAPQMAWVADIIDAMSADTEHCRILMI